MIKVEIDNNKALYTYEQKPVGIFSWDRHKHKQFVESRRLTISAIFKVKLLNKSKIELKLKSEAYLDEAPISDDKNHGPFIDVLCTSIEAVHSWDGFLEDNDRNCPKEINKRETGRAQKSRKLEYNIKHYYQGNVAMNYEPENVWKLRKDNHPERLKFGFLVPIYGWLGGWAHFPDVMCNLPSIETHMTQKWFVNYSNLKKRAMVTTNNYTDKYECEFEWIIEARTVFASIDKGVPDHGICDDRLNWITTTHQIKVLMNVNIILEDISNKINMKCNDMKAIMICATGFEKNTKSKDSIDKDGKVEQAS